MDYIELNNLEMIMAGVVGTGVLAAWYHCFIRWPKSDKKREREMKEFRTTSGLDSYATHTLENISSDLESKDIHPQDLSLRINFGDARMFDYHI
ncbi:MAG: hypothetical protein Q8N99_07420 [Nanoarchaeota archaeon]|nr:hypothetical protein [Nanoarchaeota archaeon]